MTNYLPSTLTPYSIHFIHSFANELVNPSVFSTLTKMFLLCRKHSWNDMQYLMSRAPLRRKWVEAELVWVESGSKRSGMGLSCQSLYNLANLALALAQSVGRV